MEQLLSIKYSCKMNIEWIENGTIQTSISKTVGIENIREKNNKSQKQQHDSMVQNQHECKKNLVCIQ